MSQPSAGTCSGTGAPVAREMAEKHHATSSGARFEHAEPEMEPKAAHLGEHNAQVLAEIGYCDADIQAFKKSGVLSA